MSDTTPDLARIPSVHNGASVRKVSPNGHAEVRPMRDFGSVECRDVVELVIFRFASFGRLAHVRRWLQSLPIVNSVRIAGYVNQTALFSLAVAPGTASSRLVPPGTQLVSSDGNRIELCG